MSKDSFEQITINATADTLLKSLENESGTSIYDQKTQVLRKTLSNLVRSGVIGNNTRSAFGQLYKNYSERSTLENDTTIKDLAAINNFLEKTNFESFDLKPLKTLISNEILSSVLRNWLSYIQNTYSSSYMHSSSTPATPIHNASSTYFQPIRLSHIGEQEEEVAETTNPASTLKQSESEGILQIHTRRTVSSSF